MTDAPAVRLADELRALQSAVAMTELDAGQLGRLADDLATIRASVSGPRATGRRTGYSVFHGAANPLAAPMEIVVATDTGRPELVGTVTLSSLYEGPPGHVHGGYLAGLFDDLLGGTQRLVEGGVALTGRLTIRYRQPTPLDTPLTLVAWVDSDRGRRLVVRGECRAGGRRTAEAEGLFVRLSRSPFVRADDGV